MSILNDIDYNKKTVQASRIELEKSRVRFAFDDIDNSQYIRDCVNKRPDYEYIEGPTPDPTEKFIKQEKVNVKGMVNKDVMRNFSLDGEVRRDRLIDTSEAYALESLRSIAGFTTDIQSALAQAELLTLEKGWIKLAEAKQNAMDMLPETPAWLGGYSTSVKDPRSVDKDQALEVKSDKVLESMLPRTDRWRHLEGFGSHAPDLMYSYSALPLSNGSYLSKTGLTAYAMKDREAAHFTLENLATNEVARFHATIESLSESVTPSWGSIAPVGRSEAVYFYENSDRVITMAFKLLYDWTEDNSIDTHEAHNAQLSAVGSSHVTAVSRENYIAQLNFLQRLGRPHYDEKGDFNKAPFVKATIGKFMENVTTIVDSISIDYDPLLWDIDKYEMYIPMYASVSLSFKVIHNSTPTSSYNYYFKQTGDDTNGDTQ